MLTAAVPTTDVTPQAAVITTAGALRCSCLTMAVGAAKRQIGLRGIIPVGAGEVIVAEGAAAFIIEADLRPVDKHFGGASTVVCCRQD